MFGHFKTARLFLPHKFNEVKPTFEIESLKCITFLDANAVEGLKSELPNYTALAEDVSYTVYPQIWWKDHETELPKWATACKQVLLIQLSFAATERVFSIHSNEVLKCCCLKSD